jgi:hypothetical protein
MNTYVQINLQDWNRILRVLQDHPRARIEIQALGVYAHEINHDTDRKPLEFPNEANCLHNNTTWGEHEWRDHPRRTDLEWCPKCDMEKLRS